MKEEKGLFIRNFMHRLIYLTFIYKNEALNLSIQNRQYINQMIQGVSANALSMLSKFRRLHTVCPKSLNPFYIVTCYIEWFKTSRTYSTTSPWSNHRDTVCITSRHGRVECGFITMNALLILWMPIKQAMSLST